MSYDLPPRRTPDETPPIKTQDDLCQYWRMLMGELSFSQRCLWAVFLNANGEVLPGMIQVADCPPLPDRVALRNLMRSIVGIAGDDVERHSVAFLWSRPGAAATDRGDLAWARAITELANHAMIPTWPVHHANDHELRVFTPDELAG